MDRKRVNVLGLSVDHISFENAVASIEQLIASGESHYVCVNSTQDIMISQSDRYFRQIVNGADLAPPDGWPVVWAMRSYGFNQKTRVTGPDLMAAICERSVEKGYKHFFYGGAEGVPELLAQKLSQKFPGIRIVGGYSPPFRPLTPDEDRQVIEMLNASGADILWIGISTPKQHYWMKEHREAVNIPLMFAVGAAFDFHSGRVKRAPLWMQRYYLEWLHRLWQEPRRLGMRYLRYLPAFAWKFALQRLTISDYRSDLER